MRNEHTRVVCNTFPSRGNSLTPESRIDILDDRSAFVDRNDDTQEAKAFAITPYTPIRIAPRNQWAMLCLHNFRCGTTKTKRTSPSPPTFSILKAALESNRNLNRQQPLRSSFCSITNNHTHTHIHPSPPKKPPRFPLPPHTKKSQLQNARPPREEIPRACRYVSLPIPPPLRSFIPSQVANGTHKTAGPMAPFFVAGMFSLIYRTISFPGGGMNMNMNMNMKRMRMRRGSNGKQWA